MDFPEEELIRRFRRGDGDALCALFERHEGLLRARIERWLPKHVQRRVSVSDILQESRIVAFERHLDFEPRGEEALRNWLLGIAEMKARRATQHHRDVAKRAVRREVTQPYRPETGQLRGRGPTVSELAMGAELQNLARRAVDALPPDYREVLRLTREEGLSLREAAGRMDRSYDAVKKLYGRALRRLAETLRVLRGESRG